MDDKEIVRNAICEVLAALGYEVESAVEGEQAIALYGTARAAGTPFDVVVLDMTIERGMGGREAIAKLLEIDPEVKIVVSSGYPHDPVIMDHQKFGACAVIIKPYNSSELDEVLKQVLHG
jgi:DNA-binding NarL/FixJ family response regulator